MVGSAEGIRTATTDFGCCASGEWSRPIPTDLKLVHLEGQSECTWMLEGIAAGLPKDDKRLLIRTARGIPHLQEV
jgi:hypothetical protein